MPPLLAETNDYSTGAFWSASASESAFASVLASVSVLASASVLASSPPSDGIYFSIIAGIVPSAVNSAKAALI